ncbi:hypothetical protein A3197_11635 [Candidatus Thiodiazotropha endoloripes]|nr:hypothetical protein A3197_11635 [Candidatus Thiodiazotropha endoloripes]
MFVMVEVRVVRTNQALNGNMQPLPMLKNHIYRQRALTIQSTQCAAKSISAFQPFQDSAKQHG